HSLVKNGVLQMLPDKIQMVHGPGCPVCVTPLHLIDKAVYLAEQKRVVLCSYGDMLRVPGSQRSLLEAKANGADVRILYSPLEAVRIAQSHPEKEVVFFAVGFETTAPANALSVVHAHQKGVKNYAILASHVLVPPAIEAIMTDEATSIQGFLAAGHVCTIMGYEEYFHIAEKFQVPIVVTGFEPLDLLQGILMVVEQLEAGRHEVQNQYSRVVRQEGNLKAKETMHQVFETVDREWRGMGTIPRSGLDVRPEFAAYNANVKFGINIEAVRESDVCIAGEILKGIKKPYQCSQFGQGCTPSTPMGAPMVSSEGACAAYFHYTRTMTVE
ncbi:MAG: hydrogenase formation protein HypD, partial [Calditrichae bacterium]|nr:hydrogenase formation protein HypD [Calditrichia bacterium]NIW78666.1 hydrogenase formation protein HypD [Calditrichia bacterium]